MNDNELDELLRAANPYDEVAVAHLDLGSSEADLVEALMSTALQERDLGTPPRADEPVAPTPRKPWRLVAMAVAGAAAAIAVAVGLVSVDRQPTVAYAADAVAVAETNPRMLINDPRWKVSRADEFTIERGEMTFTDGTHEIELHWSPAAEYNNFLDDRGNETTKSPITVQGRAATMFARPESTDISTLVTPNGASFLEIRGDLGSLAAYRATLAKLRSVTVEAWLAAMPDSVVKPSVRSATVDQMLTGLPLPTGFNVADVKTGSVTSDRYQLGAKVAGAVACAWFDQYFTATKEGDKAGAKVAMDALATSHTWPILHEMETAGAYPEVLWQLADGSMMTGSGPLPIDRLGVDKALGCGDHR
jgi:hypothetical protein